MTDKGVTALAEGLKHLVGLQTLHLDLSRLVYLLRNLFYTYKDAMTLVIKDSEI